jgi:exfoliative toxin A/B
MKKLIKNIPIPFAGVMLALAVGGNLLAPINPVYKSIFGLLSAICFIVLTASILADFSRIKEAFNHPVLSSVMPTYSMGIIVLSTYLIPFNKSIAFGFWSFGLLLHMVLLLIFTKNHIFNFKIKKVFPSYFIVYVGYVCASVTAPAYGMQALGETLFYFGLGCYLVLLPIILYRTLKIKNIPIPAIPTITIFAAPASLLLAGYMSSFNGKSIYLTSLLLFLSIVSILGVLLYFPKMFKNGFFPSYSAFTFPLIISAVAALKTRFFLSSLDYEFYYLNLYSEFIRYFSLMITVFILLSYIVFLRKDFVAKKEVNTKLQTN